MRKLMLMFAAFFALPSAGAISAGPVEIAIIVHNDNPHAQMSSEDVRGHYLKEKSAWSNGEKIRPVDLETDDEVRATFISKVLRTTPQDLERHWLEIKYRAAESPPRRVSDGEAVAKYVAAFKGGIGFVDATLLDKLKDKPIKVILRIKGH